MLKHVLLLAVAFAAVVFTTSAVACIWDSDTLAMEQAAFPEVSDVLAGHFVQHSQAFYRWRIADREAKLAALPADDPKRLPLLDDLAVAHEKTGDTAGAIALARQAEAIDPERYETIANLGTFLIHDGQLEEGLEYIRRAIVINPDAHFGRERYQAALVAYVMDKRGPDGKVPLPMSRLIEEGGTADQMNFAGFLAQKYARDGRLSIADRQEAVRGVVGMMHFGNSDSPILAEALGHLLVEAHSDGDDAKQLAARAFLKASYNSNDPAAATAYRRMAEEALNSQQNVDLVDIEAAFEAELEAGRDFRQQIADDERQWIEAGEDVEQRFNAKYYAGSPGGSLEAPASPAALAGGIGMLTIILLVVVVGAIGFVLVRAIVR
jgi:tetratricopeptide (TPR) repeat protein